MLSAVHYRRWFLPAAALLIGSSASVLLAGAWLQAQVTGRRCGPFRPRAESPRSSNNRLLAVVPRLVDQR